MKKRFSKEVLCLGAFIIPTVTVAVLAIGFSIVGGRR